MCDAGLSVTLSSTGTITCSPSLKTNWVRCSDIVPFHCFCQHGCHKSSGNTKLENIVVSGYCPI